MPSIAKLALLQTRILADSSKENTTVSSLEESIRPTFGGHEKFVFRHGWLKKEIDAIGQDPLILTQDEALIRLVEAGLYKFIRHPGYLGQLIIFIGISISISNWLSILVMMIPVTLGYLYRINVEERFVLEQLGEDYLKYQERTKRMIPMIY